MKPVLGQAPDPADSIAVLEIKGLPDVGNP
jgi:hypothetical protein